MEKISQEYVNERAEMYFRAVHEKNGALANCVGSTDGTVLSISRPEESREQLLMYNGLIRKQALKYQVVTTPDGLILHASGPIEGSRHYWTPYVRSGLEEQLSELSFIAGKQYVIYGDSRYNVRSFMEVPFQGSNLSATQRAFNRAMSAAMLVVEFLFKEVKLYWKTVDFKRKLSVSVSPVGALYIAALLLTNLRAYVYPNTLGHYFKCDSPTIEAYIAHMNS